jgi:DHA2 family multidrug resistance protein-like MFS transporter
VAQTGNELGYALGIAVLGSIGTAVYRLHTATIPGAGDTLAGTIAQARSLPEYLATPLLLAARNAFADGLHTVAVIAAIVLAGIAITIVGTLRRLPVLGLPPAETPTIDPETAALTR